LAQYFRGWQSGVVVKTGTEYTTGGTGHRTFTIPQNAEMPAASAQ